MSDQASKAAQFTALHVPGRPVVLFNIWDAGTARAVAAAGAKALATGSWSVSEANGYPDGEHLPLDLAIGNCARITSATDLPVSLDIESGYGATAAAVGQTVARSIEAGAIGCNLEDSYADTGKLRPMADQAERVRQARRTTEAANPGYFINARTDVFFQTAEHDAAMVDEALERARAYADAGASGLFAPGLADPALIARLTQASPLPVNLMVGAGSPELKVLAEAGAARLSYGPGPYRSMMQALEDAARAVFGELG